MKDRQRETPQADRLFNIKPLDNETVTLFFNHTKMIDEIIVLSNARRGFRSWSKVKTYKFWDKDKRVPYFLMFVSMM